MADNASTPADLAELERDLERELARGKVMSDTVKVTRDHPDFRLWVRAYPGEDTAHDEVVRAWLGRRSVRRYLAEGYGKHADERAVALADDAYQYLADDQGRYLDDAWRHAEATAGREGWSRASRLLCEVTAALAAEPEANGLPHGPRVIASHNLVIALFMSREGWCPSLSTITEARKAPSAAGCMTVTVGEQWQEGKRVRATVYDLLPADLLTQLKGNRTIPCRRPGIVRLPAAAPDAHCPRLSELDRAVLHYTIKLLQMAHAQGEDFQRHDLIAEIARFIRASGGPVVKLPPAARVAAERGRVSTGEQPPPDSPQPDPMAEFGHLLPGAAEPRAGTREQEEP